MMVPSVLMSAIATLLLNLILKSILHSPPIYLLKITGLIPAFYFREFFILSSYRLERKFYNTNTIKK